MTAGLPHTAVKALCVTWDRDFGEWCVEKGFVRDRRWNFWLWDSITAKQRAELEHIQDSGYDAVTRRKLGLYVEE